MKPHPKPTAEQISTMMPVEIDTVLAEMWAQQQGLEMQIAGRTKLINERSEKIEKIMKGLKVEGIHTPADGIQLYRRMIMANEERDYHRAELAELEAKSLPYENEYVRRGGWNRVFLANSHDGHAHNGTECSSCHNGEFRTQFTWLVRYSGLPETEIVADAGYRACTTCYPSAPVGDENTIPTQMFTEDEIEAQKAREQRDADKVKRDADKSAKGITAPDGSPLRDRHSGRIATERTAVIEAVDGLKERYSRMRVAQILEADPGLSPFFWEPKKLAEFEAKGHEYAMRLVEAIAHKRGTSTDEILAELEPKAQAKARRDGSGKDWVANMKRNASFRLEERDAYLAQCESENREPWEALSLKWPKF
ncbi:cytochrome c3 family protein [Streptomyces sp. NBC_01242]|uniref:cytochrome c3 family protein n=1 Tax=Streptomyces sp. NBC_01242 TaxID=2903795 RepID=UPI002256A0A1|nr:cytochrome c3 family protein [Streptomyces sp. NBC_01242]MCX4799639.1 cytochrome c3 family protein [Streptomyces sp. NBC_01242]